MADDIEMADSREASVKHLLLQKQIARDFDDENSTSSEIFITILEKENCTGIKVHNDILKNLPSENILQYGIAKDYNNINNKQWLILVTFKTEINFIDLKNELEEKFPSNTLLLQKILNMQKAYLFISDKDIDILTNIKASNLSIVYNAIQYFKNHPELKILNLLDEFVIRNIKDYAMIKHLFEFYKGVTFAETFQGYKIQKKSPIGWPLEICTEFNKILTGYSDKIIFISGPQQSQHYGKYHFVYKIMLLDHLHFIYDYDAKKSKLTGKVAFNDLNISLHKFVVIKIYNESCLDMDLICKLTTRKLRTSRKYSWEPEPECFRGPIFVISATPPPELLMPHVRHVVVDKPLVQLVTKEVSVPADPATPHSLIKLFQPQPQQMVSQAEKQACLEGGESSQLPGNVLDSQPPSGQAVSSPLRPVEEIPQADDFPPPPLPAASVCNVIDNAPPTPPISQQLQHNENALMCIDEEETST